MSASEPTTTAPRRSPSLSSRRFFWGVLIFTALAFLAFAVWLVCYRPVPLVVAPETTRWTEPLLPGTKRLDVIRILKEKFEPDVPPEQNGMRLIFDAIGSRLATIEAYPQYWESYCRALGLDPHAEPPLPLENMRAVADLFGEATRRQEYFLPSIIPNDANAEVFSWMKNGVEETILSNLDAYVRIVADCARWRLRADDFEGAWYDLKTLFVLGRYRSLHTDNSRTLRHEEEFYEMTKQLLSNDRVDPALKKRIRTEIRDFKPRPSVEYFIACGRARMMLYIDHTPLEDHVGTTPRMLGMNAINRSLIARRIQEHYDRLEAIFNMPASDWNREYDNYCAEIERLVDQSAAEWRLLTVNGRSNGMAYGWMHAELFGIINPFTLNERMLKYHELDEKLAELGRDE